LFEGALKHATALRVKYHTGALCHIILPTFKQIYLLMWEANA